jgi:hypothetical protein
VTDTLQRYPTGADVVAPPRELQVSKTRSIEDLVLEARELTEEMGHLRNVDAVEASDLGDVHRLAFRVQLEAHTAKVAKRAPSELLGEINDLGFGWRDVARMIGVSVPALRRWRQGEPPTGEHRLHIAELAAFLHILSDDHLVADVASWMKMPISRDAPVTGIDLYVQGQRFEIFELAGEHVTPHEALDRAEPDWRDRYRSDYEVFFAGDGQPAIRLRSTSAR